VATAPVEAKPARKKPGPKPKAKPSATDAPAAPDVAAKALTRPTTATVTRTYGKIGAPESKDETIEVHTFQTPPAAVDVGYGLTLNIGNYESARVDVRVTVPCYREELDDAYAFARKWAEERIAVEVKEVRKMASGQTRNNTPF
jgi:hypothetical protein